jgi:hypothetical protein
MSVTLKSRDVSALARPGGVNRRSGLGQARASRCGVIRMRKAGNHLISIGRGWKLNPPNRRGTDPYARWCGRGGIARCPPIPIDGREHGVTLDQVGATVLPGHGSFRGLLAAATWRRGGWHPYVPNAVTLGRAATKERGVAGPRPGLWVAEATGDWNRLSFAITPCLDLALPWHWRAAKGVEGAEPPAATRSAASMARMASTGPSPSRAPGHPHRQL